MLSRILNKKPEIPEHKFYKSCKYLPIFNFYEILESNDLRYLLKLPDYEDLPDEKTINKKQLTEVWRNINLEYGDLQLQDGENKMYFTLEKQIERLKFEYGHINMILDFLQHGWDDDIVKLLRSYPSFMGFKYKLIKQKPLFPQLEKIQRQSKNYVTRINIKVSEYERIKPDTSNSKKQQLNEIAAVLSKHCGYHLNTRKVTVSEWVGIINDFVSKNQDGNGTGHNKTGR